MANSTAMQMTVTLPGGCRLVSAKAAGEAARTHKVMTKQVGDERYNIVVFPTDATPLDNGADILDLEIRGGGGMVAVENIQCSNADLETVVSPDISTVLTGIAAIGADNGTGTPCPIYNTSGQQINKPQRSVNIYNGRKVIMNK